MKLNCPDKQTVVGRAFSVSSWELLTAVRLSSMKGRQLPPAFRCCLLFSTVVLNFLLASCAALPAQNTEPLQRTANSVLIKGVHGALSPGCSNLTIDRLQGPGQPTGIFDRHLAREQEIVGSPLTIGNSVRLLKDGPATFAAMLAAIAGAKDHINLETYILDDDVVGRRFADALIEKRRQGIQVNLIYDSVGALDTPREFFQHLLDNGVRVLEFNPVNPVFVRSGWNLNQRDHRKLLIIDGRIAFVGGINISSVHSGGSAGRLRRSSSSARAAWRDTHLELEGPVVESLQKIFLATWNAQKGEPLREEKFFPRSELVGGQLVRAISSSPEEGSSLMYVTLLSAISSAETTLHLTTAYFVPDPQLLEALKVAVRRGVSVRLILPGKSDSRLVFHAGRSFYQQLLSAGVEIYELRDAILHAKTVLIDGVWATVGSTNLDRRSFLHNHELDAVVLGTDFGSQVQTMFDIDLAGSDRIVMHDWQRRLWRLRLQESLARLWEYWL